MTFKAKPVVKRAQRPSWEGQDRRNFYLNIAFGIVVIAAVVILVIAGALTWYNDHLAPVGSVDGQPITKDELRDRFEIEIVARRRVGASSPHGGRGRAVDRGAGPGADRLAQ